jgi:type 1 glutamine amidotransferase
MTESRNAPDSRLHVLVVTAGHSFEAEPFFAMFDADSGIRWEGAEQPGAMDLFGADQAGTWDAIVMYDMPGITFVDGESVFVDPPDDYRQRFLEMLDAGQGFVFLHHAMSAWPSWPAYADIIGGRFQYTPAELHGKMWPDSGYHFDVTQHVWLAEPDHPICRGVQDGFELTDERYLVPILEEGLTPLMRTDAPMTDDHFYSAALAIKKRYNDRTGWHHPPTSPLLGWVKTAGRSPVAYLQPGHGPTAYANPNYRRLVANAIRWAASPAAHQWAQMSYAEQQAAARTR